MLLVFVPHFMPESRFPNNDRCVPHSLLPGPGTIMRTRTRELFCFHPFHDRFHSTESGLKLHSATGLTSLPSLKPSDRPWNSGSHRIEQQHKPFQISGIHSMIHDPHQPYFNDTTIIRPTVCHPKTSLI